ncbi:Bardet-Biedl syndrome 1 protein-like [Oopsacas minuta]|uniref:Bardet-Biedl syndrome 1 protein-like n=1 Tax=Oopsacas minuta TaxID=111878 RepID=A0AAV7KF23_9METZ|nr:Bardet-Biedl syndrome 1 protein-like [Oopsacas minuta]
MATPVVSTDLQDSFTATSEQVENSPSKNITDASDFWINAYQDPVAGIKTSSSCMALEDLNGDGENKLIIADVGTTPFDMRLKVYKGTSLLANMQLINLPSGLCTFFVDTNEPMTPAIAVASGPYVYVYKNLRPYFKFTLPSLDINPTEAQYWKQAKEEKLELLSFREMLEELQATDTEIPLTSRSLKLLQCLPEELEVFFNMYKHSPLKRQTVITCIDTIKKTHNEEKAISCIVIGSEHREIFILDPEAFTALARVYLPSVPVLLYTTGVYEVDYKVYVSCRDGNIYLVKGGSKIAKICIQTGSHAVGIEKQGKNILVGAMDDSLSCYTSRGKKLWTIQLPSSITTMEAIEIKSKGIKGVILGLKSGEIRLYRDKLLVNKLMLPEFAIGMKFGRFGREDSTLVLITGSGKLSIKMLKRTANLETRIVGDTLKSITPGKLNLPKKTKLYTEQAIRERENSIPIFQTFHRDLELIKLYITREYAKAIGSRLAPISVTTENIKLSAQVQGLGPGFKLSVSVQNASNIAVTGLLITFIYNPTIYGMTINAIPIPFLVPSINYTYEATVECLSDTGVTEAIRVVITKDSVSIPLLTALITMPVSLGMLIV